jgi:hypothetical protein
MYFAGVVYAHRNEEVVNYMSNAKNSDGAPPRADRKSENRKASELHLSIVENNAQVVSGDLKEVKERTKKPATNMKADQSKGDKGKLMNKVDQFASLANFKDMDKTQFSRWLLSASETEKQELLFNFKQRKKATGIT